MQLVLTVENAPNPDQVGSSYQFGHMGGSIGRSASNDWTLIDQDRFISEHHASISFENGQFLLTDQSTNGTFLNQAKQRLPRNSTTALDSDDRLLIGNLRISVQVLDERKEPVRRESRNRHDRPERHDCRTDSRRRPTDSARRTPSHRRGGSPIIPSEWTSLLGAQSPPQAARSRPARSSGQGEGTTRLRLNAAPRDGHRGAGDATTEALLDGLGLRELQDHIDPTDFSLECGSSLRELTAGLMRALQGRAQVREQLDLGQTQARRTGNNPLKFAPDTETALEQMFLGDDDDSHLAGTDAFHEALDDLRNHEIAILTAVHTVVETLIDSFDPGPLEQELRNLSPVAAKTPVLGDAKCWSLYRDHFVDVAAKLRDDARRGFLEEFARAYDAESQKQRDDEP